MFLQLLAWLCGRFPAHRLPPPFWVIHGCLPPSGSSTAASPPFLGHPRLPPPPSWVIHGCLPPSGSSTAASPPSWVIHGCLPPSWVIHGCLPPFLGHPRLPPPPSWVIHGCLPPFLGHPRRPAVRLLVALSVFVSVCLVSYLVFCLCVCFTRCLATAATARRACFPAGPDEFLSRSLSHVICSGAMSSMYCPVGQYVRISIVFIH